jgi:hypothetical protein
MAGLASLHIGFTSWRTVPRLFSSCLALRGARDRDAGRYRVLSAERVTAQLLTVPSVGHRLGVLHSAAPGSHVSLPVKQVRLCRRFDPDLRVATDPFGREG